jgi:hypothetical protein
MFFQTDDVGHRLGNHGLLSASENYLGAWSASVCAGAWSGHSAIAVTAEATLIRSGARAKLADLHYWAFGRDAV